MRARGCRLWLHAALVLAAGLLPVLACGGGGSGGGGGGGGGGPVTPTPQVTFTSAAGAAPRITLAQANPGARDTLELSVRADGVTSLYGVGFDLTYPTAQLELTGSAEGAFLSAGGTATSMQVVEVAAGRIVVGLTRLGQVAGVSGSGELLVLQFSAVGAGTGAFAFENARAFRSDGTVSTGTSFSAGSVSVIR